VKKTIDIEERVDGKTLQSVKCLGIMMRPEMRMKLSKRKRKNVVGKRIVPTRDDCSKEKILTIDAVQSDSCCPEQSKMNQYSLLYCNSALKD